MSEQNGITTPPHLTEKEREIAERAEPGNMILSMPGSESRDIPYLLRELSTLRAQMAGMKREYQSIYLPGKILRESRLVSEWANGEVKEQPGE